MLSRAIVKLLGMTKRVPHTNTLYVCVCVRMFVTDIQI